MIRIPDDVFVLPREQVMWMLQGFYSDPPIDQVGGLWITDTTIAKVIGERLRPYGWKGSVGGPFLATVRDCLEELTREGLLESSEIIGTNDRGQWYGEYIYRRLGALEALAKVMCE